MVGEGCFWFSPNLWISFNLNPGMFECLCIDFIWESIWLTEIPQKQQLLPLLKKNPAIKSGIDKLWMETHASSNTAQHD